MGDLSRRQARQYARALLTVTSEKGDDEALAVRAQLRQLATLTETNRSLQAALEARGVTLDARGRALAAIAQAAGASPALSRLLEVMAGRDHLPLLPSVAEIYATLVNEAQGIVPAEAAGAVALTAEQEAALLDVLKASTGADVELTTRVDPGLLGGLRVKMSGRTYDGTVQARLRALRQSLASGS